MSARIPLLAAALILASILPQARADQIDELIERIRVIRGDEIPAPAGAGAQVKCGTPEMLSAFNAQRHFHDSEITLAIERPALPLAFGSEHFVVHYAVEGPDSVYHPAEDISPADGVPDFVNRTAEIFEQTWSVEVDSLGFLPPPKDNVNGGDGRMDIYAVNLGFGYFGFTVPESTTAGYTAFSFLIVESDFAQSSYVSRPLDGLRVTAAHEFFHTVQFGYDAYEFENWEDTLIANYKPWWLEASATWMEDIVYDDINDYWGYLEYFYKFPWMGLTRFAAVGDQASRIHPYASCVWPMYMSEKYDDAGVVREIWERCGDLQGYNVLPATDDALIARGSSLDAAFLEFAVWNFHTGPLADTALYFSEGDSFPAVDTTAVAADLNLIPYFPVDDVPRPPEDLAANYIVIEPNPVIGGVNIEFNGEDLFDDSWEVGVLGFRQQTGIWTSIPLTPGSWEGTGEWRNWHSYDAIVVIPVVTGEFASGETRHPYSARMTFEPSLFLQRDVGPLQFLSVPGAGRRGDPIDPVIRFFNQGQEAASFQASLVITELPLGNILYDEDIPVSSLPANDVISLEFPRFTPMGIDKRYALRAITVYEGDQFTRNDTIQAIYTSLGHVGRLLTAYPSPFVIDGSSRLTIPYSYTTASRATRLFIYDVSGALVREVEIERHPTGGASFMGFKWDGRNENGDYVASGVYIFMVNSDSDSRTGKIAVVNRR